jgi:hypothetical protein
MCRSLRAIAIVVAVLSTTVSFGQTVSIKDGNVFYKAKDQRAIQITSSGLDSYPSLCVDKRMVVFVRRTPELKIDTGIGDADDNELWIAVTTGKEPPRRVLVGHPGGFKQDDNLVLAGFSHPQFSPDARRIYFEAQTWATDNSVRMLELKTGRVRFLFAGGSLEVLQSGTYAGYLSGLKDIPRVRPGRTWRYWLLDPDGKDVGEIGEESDVREFKTEHL